MIRCLRLSRTTGMLMFLTAGLPGMLAATEVNYPGDFASFFVGDDTGESPRHRMRSWLLRRGSPLPAHATAIDPIDSDPPPTIIAVENDPHGAENLGTFPVVFTAPSN